MINTSIISKRKIANYGGEVLTFSKPTLLQLHCVDGAMYIPYGKGKLREMNRVMEDLDIPMLSKNYRMADGTDIVASTFHLHSGLKLDRLSIVGGASYRQWIFLVDGNQNHTMMELVWGKKQKENLNDPDNKEYKLIKTKKKLTTNPWWFMPELSDGVSGTWQLQMVNDSTIYTTESNPKHNQHDVRLPSLCYWSSIEYYGLLIFISWTCGIAMSGRNTTFIPEQNGSPAYSPYSANVDEDENVYPIKWVIYQFRKANSTNPLVCTGRKHVITDKTGIKKLHIGIYLDNENKYALVYKAAPDNWTAERLNMTVGTRKRKRHFVTGFGWDTPSHCDTTWIIPNLFRDIICTAKYLQPPMWQDDTEQWDIAPIPLATMRDKPIYLVKDEDMDWNAIMSPEAIQKKGTTTIVQTIFAKTATPPPLGEVLINEVTHKDRYDRTFQGADNITTYKKKTTIHVGNISVDSFETVDVIDDLPHASPVLIDMPSSEIMTKLECPDPWAHFILGHPTILDETIKSTVGFSVWHGDEYYPLPCTVSQSGNRYVTTMDYDFRRNEDTFALIVMYDTLEGEHHQEWFTVLETFLYGFPKVWSRVLGDVIKDEDTRKFHRYCALYYCYKGGDIHKIIFPSSAEGISNELGVTFLTSGWEVQAVSLQVTDVNIIYTYTAMELIGTVPKKKYIGIINLEQRGIPKHYHQTFEINGANHPQFFDNFSYRANVAIGLHREGSTRKLMAKGG